MGSLEAIKDRTGLNISLIPTVVCDKFQIYGASVLCWYDLALGFSFGVCVGFRLSLEAFSCLANKMKSRNKGGGVIWQPPS